MTTHTAAYQRGIAITASGALVLTFDTLVIRLIGATGTTIAFWRGILMCAAILIGWRCARRWIGADAKLINGWPGLLTAACYGVASVCFVLAATHTSVANMLFIVATAPLFAAALSVLVLRETVPRDIWVAITLSLTGIGVIVADGLSAGGLLGDCYALGAAVAMACAFVTTRGSGRNTFTAPGIGGLLSAAILAPFVGHFTLTGTQWPWMLLEGLVVMPVALGLIGIGPRFVPAAQVGLFLLLETVLGPLWVWLALGETPSAKTLLGGAIILITLAAHSVYSMTRRTPAKPASGNGPSTKDMIELSR